jgi:hypothetical protein
MKGLTQETARRALSNEGVFDREFPEMERGVAWRDLPPSRRSEFEALGWTQREWTLASSELRGSQP